MTIIQIISLIILFFIIGINFKKDTDILSPGKVFLVIWSVVLFITEFKFSLFQHTWSLFAWITLLMGIIAFSLGNLIANTVLISNRLYSLKSIRSNFRMKKFNLNKLLVFLVGLFIIYFSAWAFEIILYGEIPIFSLQPDKARTEFGVFGIHLIVNLFPSILFLCIEYFVLQTTQTKHKIFVWVIFFITFFSYFFLLQRLNYFFWGTLTFTFLYYSSNSLNLKKIITGLIILIIIMWGINSIRVAQYATQYLYVISKMKYSSDYASFTGPYMYIVMNMENFANGVNRLQQHSYGILSGDWFVALIGIKSWLAEYFNVDYRKFVYSSYNTYPIFWNFYYDFGLIGVVISSLVLGYLSSLFYFLFRITMRLKYMVMYGIILFGIVMSFFTNIFTSLNFMANILLLWWVNSRIMNEQE
ncbi:MAG: oligosaccharide repeat unit polymerase [Ignavibacteriaceae bacterium]|nr:oligosaccharide repeat unit polymerase [Ignavibacteriaceae bacterium]